MSEHPKESALVLFTMPQLEALEKLLRGQARMLAIKNAKGDEVSAERVEMTNQLLNVVMDTRLTIETYDIIGDVMRDGTFEEIVETWQSATGDHG